MEKHFVRFMSPGIFAAEQREKPINEWDVAKAKEMLTDIVERYGVKPYGFYFVTKTRNDNELDSYISSTSGTYYINGEVDTIESLIAKGESPDGALIWNMKTNRWDKVVITHTPYKWIQPFDESKDRIIKV